MIHGARRIWVETATCEQLLTARSLGLLIRYRLQPLVAVRPWQLHGLSELTRRLAGEGIRFGLWPMLADEHGRYANAQTAARFARLARDVIASAGEHPPETMVIDLEPPYAAVRALFVPGAVSRAVGALAQLRAILSSARRGAMQPVRSLVFDLRVRAIEVYAAVPVLLAFGPWLGGTLSTPVAAGDYDIISAMTYSSILEGLSAGILRRATVERLLWLVARKLIANYPTHGVALCLGVVGAGAFIREPVYETPNQLARDVEIATASGIQDLSLFDLGGVLVRPPAEAWLEAFTRSRFASRVPPSVPST